MTQFAPPVRPQAPLRSAITAACRRDERDCVADLLDAAPPESPATAALARKLIEALRAAPAEGAVQGLVREYALSSKEGVALMCLAEALLRIPDAATRDALIRDKIAPGDWRAHLGDGRSLFVNAATWGLVVTGKLVGNVDDTGLGAALTRLVARAGEPVIRRAVDLAMRLMGEQFVTGENIAEALRRASEMERKGFTYSFDMLGEAAMTAADADRYSEDYRTAITAIGAASSGRGIYAGPGISIKLSALHPRYSRAQAGRVMAELLPRVRDLALMAKQHDIGLNIDAEEADRLELSLDILESLATDPALTGWDGLGFVVQAYGKRCPLVIDWIIELAHRSQRRIMVRLVKGAYWDAEIKRAQVDGLAGFPVFTRKVHTDLSYLVCARKLLDAGQAVFPQFATHNAQTLAAIHAMAGPDFAVGDYEFQCLHGMGEPLYEQVVGPDKLNRPCRIYAPVGTHETLLAYLVRRLLENGANSSFVNRIADPDVPVEALLADPAGEIRAAAEPGAPHKAIALPADIMAPRRNSAGLDLASEPVLAELGTALAASAAEVWSARPMIAELEIDRRPQPVRNPADHRDIVGTTAFALERDAAHAAQMAARAALVWAETPVETRAAMLELAADAMEADMPRLIALIVREAGKSVSNAVGEVREAVDFLRFYAAEARAKLAGTAPIGPIVCISPWNFPLAIFTGQIAAALAAGNPVLAKPSEATTLIAAEAVRILHAAGVPEAVLQFVPGDGAVGAALVDAPQVAGVMFTGSTEVARLIQRQLSARLSPHGTPVVLIAETGGQNAMIVDSSALTEQVVGDVIASAFDSAGQRCSALRILCLQDDIADRTIAMLHGALHELAVGNPALLATDIGPVITASAQGVIEAHLAAMRASGHAVAQFPLPPEAALGTFVAPAIVEISSIAQLGREVFGPVLHVLRFAREEQAALAEAINATGYGLTFGLHTRLDSAIAETCAAVAAGNLYINRNTIGAIVGSQPFGGCGLSGTGPKAGGPLYLLRLIQGPVAAKASVPPDPAVAELADWCDDQGDAATAQMLRAITSPVGGKQQLPGPVGEANEYGWHPRGTVLLFPATRAGLFNQLGTALSAGNRFAVAANHHLLPGLPAAVLARAGNPVDASAALIEGEGAAVSAILADLAARPGPIITPNAAATRQMHDPAAFCGWWLVDEVSVSVNTTAAGGNASLMALA